MNEAEEPGELPLMRNLHALKHPPKGSPALKARSRKPSVVENSSLIAQEPIFASLNDAFDEDWEAVSAMLFRQGPEGGDGRRETHFRRSDCRRKQGQSRTPLRTSPRLNSRNAKMQLSYDNDTDSRVSWGSGVVEGPAIVDASTPEWLHHRDAARPRDGNLHEARRGSRPLAQDRTTEWVTSSANEDFGTCSVNEHQARFFLQHHDEGGRFDALQKASKLEQGHKQWTQSDQILSPLILNPNSDIHNCTYTNSFFHLECPSDAEAPSDHNEWVDYARASQREETSVKAGSRPYSSFSPHGPRYAHRKHTVGKGDARPPQMTDARNVSRQKYSEDSRAVPSESEFFEYEVEAMELPCSRQVSGESMKKFEHLKESRRATSGGKDETIRRSSPGTRRSFNMNAGHQPSERDVSSKFPIGTACGPELLPLPPEFEDYNGSEEYGATSVDCEHGRLPMSGLHGELELVACNSAALDRKNPGRPMERSGSECLQLFVQQGCKELALCDNKPRNLSQKYRPKAFEDVVGQHIVAQALSNAVQMSRIAPVYLFQGSRGTGKTSAARIFSAALLCVSAEVQRPCGACRECISVALGKCSEVREVDAASNNGVERVKSLLEETISAPPVTRYKVFIIDECHVLTAETWNCLLKILEEPPMNVVFILITTESDQLPRTVVSRCQRFPFPRIKDTEIVKRLQKLASLEDLAIDAETLQLIASRSEGSLRDAETILDQASLLGQQINSSNVYQLVGSVSDEKFLGLLNSALVADTISTVRRARELLDFGVEPLSLMSRLAALITDILAGSFKFFDHQRKGFFRRQSLSEAKLERLRVALKTMSEAEKQLRTSNDRATWLIAALLQLGPDRSHVFSASYVSSVSESPIALDEKEVLDFEHRSSDRQTWPDRDRDNAVANGDSESVPMDNRNGHDYTSYGRSQCWSTESAPKNASKETCSSLPIPGEAASMPLRGTEGSAIPTVSPDEDFDSGIDQRLNPSKLNDIWCKVVERCQSNPLKQLLYASVRLTSISICEVDAVVHLEIFNPEDNASCARSQKRIANLFEMVLGFPVDVKMSLASLSAEPDSPKTPEDDACAGSGSQLPACSKLKGNDWEKQGHNAMRTQLAKGYKAMEARTGVQYVAESKKNVHINSPAVVWSHVPLQEVESHPITQEVLRSSTGGDYQEAEVSASMKPRGLGVRSSSGEQQAQHCNFGNNACKDVEDINADLHAEERELDESELLSLDFNEELDDEHPVKNWRARHSTYDGPVAVDVHAFDGRRSSDADSQRRKGSHLNMVRRMSMRSRIRSLPSSDPNSPDRVGVNVVSAKYKDEQVAVEDLQLARDAVDCSTNSQKRGKFKGSLARFFQGKLSKHVPDNQ